MVDEILDCANVVFWGLSSGRSQILIAKGMQTLASFCRAGAIMLVPQGFWI